MTAQKQFIAPASMYSDGTYLKNNSNWHVEDSAWKAEKVLHMLVRHKLKPKTVCEVGCGAGEILKVLSEALPDVKFAGYEISEQAYALAKPRENENVKYFFGDLLEVQVKSDLLLCMDVFEHVEDYFGFLRGLRNKAKYHMFHIPLDLTASNIARRTLIDAHHDLGHVHHFSKDTALATLADCGYRVLDCFYTKAFSELGPKTAKARLIRLPRGLFYSLSPDLMVRMLGGCSLLVLASAEAVN